MLKQVVYYSNTSISQKKQTNYFLSFERTIKTKRDVESKKLLLRLVTLQQLRRRLPLIRSTKLLIQLAAAIVVSVIPVAAVNVSEQPVAILP